MDASGGIQMMRTVLALATVLSAGCLAPGADDDVAAVGGLRRAAATQYTESWEGRVEPEPWYFTDPCTGVPLIGWAITAGDYRETGIGACGHFIERVEGLMDLYSTVDGSRYATLDFDLRANDACPQTNFAGTTNIFTSGRLLYAGGGLVHVLMHFHVTWEADFGPPKLVLESVQGSCPDGRDRFGYFTRHAPEVQKRPLAWAAPSQRALGKYDPPRRT